jgi:hypothetical protein
MMDLKKKKLEANENHVARNLEKVNPERVKNKYYNCYNIKIS